MIRGKVEQDRTKQLQADTHESRVGMTTEIPRYLVVTMQQ